MKPSCIGLVGLFLCCAFEPSHARTGPPEPDVLDADDPSISDDGRTADKDLVGTGPSDEDLVIAAQKVRTTIQEAPSIITVVTRQQMRERGYRTLNDVLRTVPGFEGDRWEYNGWHKEAFARGNPQTVLVLLNGVNIVEPVRNTVSLDRKIPLELIERIEVTSGPGGVLWGSNALLGIVNIVTRGPDDTGIIAVFGAGDGPGERLALKGSLGYSHRFNEDVGLMLHVDMFSTMGAELTVDVQKVIGALPEPAPDSPTLYLPTPATVAPNSRSWFFNFAGRLELGPVSFDWMLPFEQEYRPIATGGSNIMHDFLTNTDGTGVETAAADSISLGILSYRDRFADDTVGVTARAYLVSWEVDENPFGIYAASPVVLAQLGHTQDVRIALVADQIMRPGGAVDVDWRVTETLTLLAGAEVFADILHGLNQTSWSKDALGVCPEGFTYNEFDPYLHCKIVERQITDSERTTGGGFIQADWKVHPRLALTGGLRGQLSSQYGASLLYSGGLVWKMFDQTHMKLFASVRSASAQRRHEHERQRPDRVGRELPAQPRPRRRDHAQSIELEVNTILLKDVGIFRDLYLRANGALHPARQHHRPARRASIRTPTHATSSRPRPSRACASTQATSSGPTTPGRACTTKARSGGACATSRSTSRTWAASVQFLNERIELDLVVNFKGEMKDPNRPAMDDPERPDYSVSVRGHPRRRAAARTPRRVARVSALPTPVRDGIWVRAGQVGHRGHPAARAARTSACASRTSGATSPSRSSSTTCSTIAPTSRTSSPTRA